MDKANTCQRSQCECDKALAYDLSDKEYMWSLMNHRDWSIFDADTRCTVQEKEKFWRRIFNILGRHQIIRFSK